MTGSSIDLFGGSDSGDYDQDSGDEGPWRNCFGCVVHRDKDPVVPVRRPSEYGEDMPFTSCLGCVNHYEPLPERTPLLGSRQPSYTSTAKMTTGLSKKGASVSSDRPPSYSLHSNDYRSGSSTAGPSSPSTSGRSQQTQWSFDDGPEPVFPAVGLDKRFISEHETTITLREKMFSWSGDDYSVRDANGNLVLRCQGHALSPFRKKTILDPEGNPLFTLQNVFFSLLGEINAYAVSQDGSDGKVLFNVERDFTCCAGRRLQATFRDAFSGARCVVSLESDICGLDAVVRLHRGKERPPLRIATIVRDVDARDLLADAHTYHVRISQGIDVTLVAAICIAFDELNH